MNPGGPKSAPTPAPAPAPKPAQKKPEKPGEEDNTLAQVSAMVGMGSLGSFKKAMSAWAELMELLINLGDEFENMRYSQSHKAVKKGIEKMKKRIKTPPIENKNIKTDLETKHEGSLVSYLYKALKIPMPSPNQFKITNPPKTKGGKSTVESPKEVGIQHMMIHMSKNFSPVKAGEKRIMKGIRPKGKNAKPTFYKGDLMFFRNKFDKTLTAGFIVAANATSVWIKNNEDAKPQKINRAKLYMGIHIPGNKPNGPIPKSIKPKKKKKAKVA